MAYSTTRWFPPDIKFSCDRNTWKFKFYVQERSIFLNYLKLMHNFILRNLNWIRFLIYFMFLTSHKLCGSQYCKVLWLIYIIHFAFTPISHKGNLYNFKSGKTTISHNLYLHNLSHLFRTFGTKVLPDR